jgi:two-component SAPR family response regulator
VVTALKRVKALGRPQVWIGSRCVSKKAWGSKRAQELFFLLVNHPAGLTKHEIMECLCPETEGDRSDGLFHSTLYRCRRALGKDTVVWEEGIYRVGDIAEWVYDVADFEALVKRGRLIRDETVEAERIYRDALQLYEGDYLEGWLSEWCDATREGLRQSYVEAVLALAKLCVGRGLLDDALEFYKLAIEKDYYSEAAHKGVIDTLLALGDRLAAMRHYIELVERLKEDVSPEARSQIPPLVDDMLGRSLTTLVTAERIGQDDC